MNFLHDFFPHGDGRVAVVADPLVLVIARPHRRHIVGCEAHEVAVIVFVCGSGLARDVHAVELRLASGTGGNGVFQHVRHKIGGGLLHGHTALPRVFQHRDLLAGGVVDAGDPHIGPGLVVNALVGEAGVGRRHLHGVQAVGQAAHA